MKDNPFFETMWIFNIQQMMEKVWDKEISTTITKDIQGIRKKMLYKIG